MMYQEAVTEARGLVRRSDQDEWRLAELTWEQVKINGKSAVSWAQDIGAAPDRVSRWLRVWREYAEYAAADRPSFEDAMAPHQRHSEVARTERGVRNLPPERKAAVARDLLAEPGVADQVVQDPETAAHVAQAQIRRHQERIREGAAERERSMPDDLQRVNRDLSQRDAQLQLGQICDRFAADVARVAPSAIPVAEGEKFWLSGARDRAAMAVTIVTSCINGETGLDAELEKIQGGEHSG